MARRLTKETKYVRLPERRIREIEDLVASWPYETKAFMRARLNQYKPPSDLTNTFLDTFLSFFMASHERHFEILKDPEILTDWQTRFEVSGQTKPQEAWNKILEKELSSKDYIYLLSGGKVVAHGSADDLSQSDSTWAKQFMNGEPDGPVPFHYPAADLHTDLLQKGLD